MSGIASNYYENFKKNYTLNSFKTRFASLYKAAIKDIKNHKESDSFNYKSQKYLVEYYIYAKLVDTELLTKDAFDNLNKIIMMDDSNPDYKTLTKLTIHDIGNTRATIQKNGSTNMAMSDIVSATLTDNISIYQNQYFLNLLLLLLTIRFYPFAILNNIYENGKYNIQSIKKNIEAMTSQENAIQNIVTTIESREQVDPIIGTPPIQDEVARRIGLTTTLSVVTRVDATKDLVEYSSKILHKALALLSLSIGFSNINKDNGLLIKIMPSLIYSINTYFIAVVIDKNSTTNQKTISELQNLKTSLLALMTDANNQTIIANISKIHSSGALSDDYNTNLQISIIKGIDSSAFFRLNNVSASITKGGQRTQKNRNKSRSISSGGTRKNMNSIEYDL